MSILTCYIRLVSFVIDMREHIGDLRAFAGSISLGLTASRGAADQPEERVMNERQKRSSTVGNDGDSENPPGIKSMKRTFALILAALAAAALFGGLVQAVLVAAHVSEPAATTVYGLTSRRLWATTVAVLALVGLLIGGLALARSRRFG